MGKFGLAIPFGMLIDMPHCGPSLIDQLTAET